MTVKLIINKILNGFFKGFFQKSNCNEKSVLQKQLLLKLLAFPADIGRASFAGP